MNRSTPARAADRRAAVDGRAGPDGVVVGLAIDHRDNFRAVLQRGGREESDMPGLKERIVRGLAPIATAVMLDQELGMVAIKGGAVPKDVSLVMPLEEQGYEQLGDDRTTALMTTFDARKAARLGASAAKLLLPYRADQHSTAARQRAVAAQALAAAHAAGLPLILEPTVYRLEAEPGQVYEARYEQLVLAATAETATLRPDVLKLPYPTLVDPSRDMTGAKAACRRLDASTGGIPWVLLGAVADAADFELQLELAGEAGASGFLAGRAIWTDAVLASDAKRGRAIDDARATLARCAGLARETAVPIGSRTH